MVAAVCSMAPLAANMSSLACPGKNDSISPLPTICIPQCSDHRPPSTISPRAPCVPALPAAGRPRHTACSATASYHPSPSLLASKQPP